MVAAEKCCGCPDRISHDETFPNIKSENFALDVPLGFCKWLNPLKNMRPFDCTPRTRRRSLTSDEVERLLQAAPASRRLLYQTALATGLRALELGHLTLQHLDLERSGLHLEADWTKNRKDGFQPLPAWLADALHESASQGDADDLYAFHYGSGVRPVSHPSLPLVYVSSHPSRTFQEDCVGADIPFETEAGRAVFHSLRITFINRVIVAGATLKEAQALARHASPEMTFNVYGRTESARMVETVESASAGLNFFSACVTCVSTELAQAAGGNNITQQYQQDRMGEKDGKVAGSIPAASIFPLPSFPHKTALFCAVTCCPEVSLCIHTPSADHPIDTHFAIGVPEGCLKTPPLCPHLPAPGSVCRGRTNGASWPLSAENVRLDIKKGSPESDMI